MTRCSGNTGRGKRVNCNAQNVFFMRAESIMIWRFLFVARMSRVGAKRKAIFKSEGVDGRIDN